MTKLMSKEMIQYAESMLKALNKPMVNFETVPYEVGRTLIVNLKKELAKNKEYFASEQQLKTIREMVKCPFINKAFIEELGIIPTSWVQAKQKLEDEIVVYNKILVNGYARKKVCVMGELEEVADTLFSQGKISQSEYDDLLWYRTSLDRVLAKNDLIEIEGYIYERKVLNKDFINSKIEQLKERIATANAKIEEKTSNPYLFLPKEDVSRFITTYTSMYKQWLNNRLSDKQLYYIKELHFRVNGTHLNEEGYSLLSKKQASLLIAQLESEAKGIQKADKDFEREHVSYTGNEYGQEGNVAWESDSKEWATLLHSFTSLLGYKPEVEEGDIYAWNEDKDLVTLTNTGEQLLELIKLANLLGNDMQLINDRLINAYDFDVYEMELLNLRMTTEKVESIEKDKQATLEKVKKMLDLNYLDKEDLIKLLAD